MIGSVGNWEAGDNFYWGFGSPAFHEVFGSSDTLFWITLIASIIACIHGLSKAIMSGPTRVLPEPGKMSFLAHGLCYTMVIMTVLSKEEVIAAIIDNNIQDRFRCYELISMMFLPNLIFGFCGLYAATRSVKDCLKLVCQLPMLVLLPMHTPFAHSTLEDSENKNDIGISPGFTMGNMFLHGLELVFLAPGVRYAPTQAQTDCRWRSSPNCGIFATYFYVGFMILFLVIFLYKLQLKFKSIPIQ